MFRMGNTNPFTLATLDHSTCLTSMGRAHCDSPETTTTPHGARFIMALSHRSSLSPRMSRATQYIVRVMQRHWWDAAGENTARE